MKIGRVLGILGGNSQKMDFGERIEPDLKSLFKQLNGLYEKNLDEEQRKIFNSVCMSNRKYGVAYSVDESGLITIIDLEKDPVTHIKKEPAGNLVLW